MRRNILFPTLAACVLLAGCDAAGGLFSSAEDRINAAIPLAETVTQARTALERLLPAQDEAGRKAFEAEMQSRLRIRALSCAKGYSPSLVASKSTIQGTLSDRKCFEDFDSDLRFWVNQRRVAVMLSLPPLRPIPKAMPRFIVGNRGNGVFTFADSAGIALLTYGRSLQVVDIGTSEVIFDEDGIQDGNGGGRPSANGRLFIGGLTEGPVVRDAETGERLLEYHGYSTLRWLGATRALAEKRADEREVLLIDFAKGEETRVRGVNSGTLFGAVAVPGEPNRFVLSQPNILQMIELQPGKEGMEAKLIGEKPLEGPSMWADNTGARNADGSLYVTGSKDLAVISLASMHDVVYSLEPFYVQTALPTPNGNEVIVTGFVKGLRESANSAYVVSLRDWTVAPIDESIVRSGFMTYIRPLNLNGVVRGGRVEVLDTLPHGPFVTFDEQITAWKGLLSAPEQIQYGILSGTIASPADSPLIGLAKNAEVEAVGVYESTTSVHSYRGSSRTGEIAITVKRSSKPLVLVLSSYEPIHWKLKMQGGANIALILISSYGTGVVSGAGDVRTAVIGRASAYERGGQEFRQLDAAVFGATGKRIGVFQGTYKGQSFSVGGS